MKDLYFIFQCFLLMICYIFSIESISVLIISQQTQISSMGDYKSMTFTPIRKVSDSLSLTFTKLRDQRIQSHSGIEAQNKKQKLRIAKQRESTDLSSARKCKQSTNKSEYTDRLYSTPMNLKSQKRKYLKLFTTVSTHNSNAKQADGISNQSQCQSVIVNDRQDNWLNSGMKINSQEQLNQKSSMSRFCELTIEQQEKIYIQAPQEYQSEKIHVRVNNLPISSMVKKKKQKIQVSRALFAQSTVSEQLPEIKQIFRYCIGCLKSVLQANIYFHEKRCLKFQQVSSMSFERLSDYIQKQISSIKSDLQSRCEQFNELSIKNMIKQAHSFIQQCQLAAINGQINQIYNYKLNQMHDSSQSFMCYIEDINRLHWFLKMWEKIRKQYQN